MKTKNLMAIWIFVCLLLVGIQAASIESWWTNSGQSTETVDGNYIQNGDIINIPIYDQYTNESGNTYFLSYGLRPNASVGECGSGTLDVYTTTKTQFPNITHGNYTAVLGLIQGVDNCLNFTTNATSGSGQICQNLLADGITPRTGARLLRYNSGSIEFKNVDCINAWNMGSGASSQPFANGDIFCYVDYVQKIFGKFLIVDDGVFDLTISYQYNFLPIYSSYNLQYVDPYNNIWASFEPTFTFHSFQSLTANSGIPIWGYTRKDEINLTFRAVCHNNIAKDAYVLASQTKNIIVGNYKQTEIYVNEDCTNVYTSKSGYTISGCYNSTTGGISYIDENKLSGGYSSYNNSYINFINILGDAVSGIMYTNSSPFIMQNNGGNIIISNIFRYYTTNIAKIAFFNTSGNYINSIIPPATTKMHWKTGSYIVPKDYPYGLYTGLNASGNYINEAMYLAKTRITQWIPDSPQNFIILPANNSFQNANMATEKNVQFDWLMVCHDASQTINNCVGYINNSLASYPHTMFSGIAVPCQYPYWRANNQTEYPYYKVSVKANGNYTSSVVCELNNDTSLYSTIPHNIIVTNITKSCGTTVCGLDQYLNYNDTLEIWFCDACAACNSGYTHYLTESCVTKDYINSCECVFACSADSECEEWQYCTSGTCQSRAANFTGDYSTLIILKTYNATSETSFLIPEMIASVYYNKTIYLFSQNFTISPVFFPNTEVWTKSGYVQNNTSGEYHTMNFIKIMLPHGNTEYTININSTNYNLNFTTVPNSIMPINDFSIPFGIQIGDYAGIFVIPLWTGFNSLTNETLYIQQNPDYNILNCNNENDYTVTFGTNSGCYITGTCPFTHQISKGKGIAITQDFLLTCSSFNQGLCVDSVNAATLGINYATTPFNAFYYKCGSASCQALFIEICTSNQCSTNHQMCLEKIPKIATTHSDNIVIAWLVDNMNFAIFAILVILGGIQIGTQYPASNLALPIITIGLGFLLIIFRPTIITGIILFGVMAVFTSWIYNYWSRTHIQGGG